MNLKLWPVNVRWNQEKCHALWCNTKNQQNWENYWVVANSGPSALNFSHLPGWYFDQKEDFLKKKLQTQEEPPAPRMANQDLIEVSTSPQSGSQH